MTTPLQSAASKVRDYLLNDPKQELMCLIILDFQNNHILNNLEADSLKFAIEQEFEKGKEILGLGVEYGALPYMWNDLGKISIDFTDSNRRLHLRQSRIKWLEEIINGETNH